MGQTSCGPFREVIDLGGKISVWVILWDLNKAIDIGEWSIWGGGQLETFFYIYTVESLSKSIDHGINIKWPI